MIIYYKIEKSKNLWIVFKYKEYKRRYYKTEMYTSKYLFKCYKFVKSSKYELREVIYG